MTGIFKARYPELSGVAWIRQLSSEDFQFFVKLGLQAADYGRLGGKARASTALRDRNGKFMPKDTVNTNG